MSKHKPHKKVSCAEADRVADEQIADLVAEVARLRAELATKGQPLIIQQPVTPPYQGWWQQPWTITCDVTAATTTDPRGSFRIIEGEAS